MKRRELHPSNQRWTGLELCLSGIPTRIWVVIAAVELILLLLLVQ